ncbi:hypothetical protein IHE45_07G129800 [Dioscorea alata]|uniref:Uncharacterized protein n=1 Tax=Dioscorea alata TaxID=55571 RepID=A0ACB7VU40_DIOAL|nr:hypothetical protein IHE45_07G129800 [Dioscorea alata]
MAALLLPQSSTIAPLITATKLCTAPSSYIPLFGKRFARIPCKRYQLWKVSAVGEEALSSEPVIENAQQVVPSGNDDISSSIVSTLLLIAFVGLSILTIGVIYLGVTDFLQKREREKFEKEEATKKKKNGKKGKVKSRAGPRGFGQKVEEDDDVDD